ncbi:MAG: ATP-binding protein [Polyangiaceae bacterium]|nr:ATP-binding protein [Polyangiaceae bacterium]
MSLRFLEAHRHVCILGPVGVGKTFVASALGHVACRHGYNVRFARADATLRRLRQSRFDNSRDAGDDRSDVRRPAHHRRLRARADDQGGEQRRLPALPRAHRSRLDDRHQQSRHRRVARHVRRRPARPERRRPLPERRLRLRHGGRSPIDPGSSRRSTLRSPPPASPAMKTRAHPRARARSR